MMIMEDVTGVGHISLWALALLQLMRPLDDHFRERVEKINHLRDEDSLRAALSQHLRRNFHKDKIELGFYPPSHVIS